MGKILGAKKRCKGRTEQAIPIVVVRSKVKLLQLVSLQSQLFTSGIFAAVHKLLRVLFFSSLSSRVVCVRRNSIIFCSQAV